MNETNKATPKTTIDETFGNLMLVIPIAYAIFGLAWTWSMELSLNPASKLNDLRYLSLFAISIIATIEASKLGMGNNSDLTANGKRRRSPIAWFVFISLIFIIGYPWYLYHRSKYGMKNRLSIGFVIILIYLVAELLHYLLAPWKLASMQ
jgi:hypothetical protein